MVLEFYLRLIFRIIDLIDKKNRNKEYYTSLKIRNNLSLKSNP